MTGMGWRSSSIRRRTANDAVEILLDVGPTSRPGSIRARAHGQPTRPRRRQLAAPIGDVWEAPPAAGKMSGRVGRGRTKMDVRESLWGFYDVSGRTSSSLTLGTGMRWMASCITATLGCR
jgi:hypothetical protein